jgi:hypothetical protein
MLTAEQKAYVRHLVAKRMSDKSGTDYGGLTDKAFAELIGRAPSTLRAWAALPEVAQAVEQSVIEVETSSDYMKTVSRHRALEEMWVLYEKAKGAEKRQLLRMILKETETAETADAPVDFSDLSDDALLDVMLTKDITSVGMTRAELEALRHARG